MFLICSLVIKSVIVFLNFLIRNLDFSFDSFPVTLKIEIYEFFIYYRLTLLWYHTVVRPFCALDGNNVEKGRFMLAVNHVKINGTETMMFASYF